MADAAWGALAWLAYAIVELTLSTGIQLWRNPEMEILGWQWRLIAAIMGAYGLIGIGAGVLGGLVTPGSPKTFASLTIALAFGGVLAFGWSLGGPEYIALAMALFLSATLVVALFSERTRARIQFLANPWTASLLLLGAPWMGREVLLPGISPVVKAGLSTLFVAAIAGAAAIVSRLGNRRPRAMRALTMTAIAIFGAFLAGIVANGKDSVVQPDLRPPDRNLPNVVLIVMDTVRADHTSLYGYERDTTPNLREFARGATLYSHAVATSDYTLPAHGSMFTGLYRDWHGAFRPDGERPQALRADRQTLAEVLRSYGYWTASVAANFAYLAPWTGLIRGFTVTVTGRPVDLAISRYPFYLRRVARRLMRLAMDTTALDRETLTASEVEARTGPLLNRIKARGGPFFLFVNYMDAHFPYVPDAPFDTRFPGKTIESSSLGEWRRQATLDRHPLTSAERSYLNSQYDGGIAEEDESIGRVLGRLRELGMYDNTIIIVTSDHGEGLGEHDLLRHELGFVYQNLVSVPLLVKYPGQLEARRSDELVSQVDFMPTILDLAGIPAPEGIQGISLAAPGVDRTDRVVFSSAGGLQRVANLNPRFGGTRHAIFAGSMKLIASTSGQTEMYDLSVDPAEEHNLYSPDDPRAVELSRRLNAWIASIPRRSARPQSLDPAARERLRSLGYVQ